MSKADSQMTIEFSHVMADDTTGSASWTADYVYGPDKRPVTNHVQAKFKFQDGKIIEHRDHFGLWKWSRQALGAAGMILGWTPMMKSKIQSITNARLDQFTQRD